MAAKVKKKEVSRLVLHLTMLLLGAALIIWPVNAAGVLTITVGVVLMGCGAIEAVLFALDKEKSALDVGRLIGGIILFILGLYLLLNPDTLARILNWFFGSIIILYGLVNLVSSFLSKKLGGRWWISLLLSICAILLGVVILLDPFKTVTILMYVVGGTLIIAAITGIITTIRLRKTAKVFTETYEGETVTMKDAGSDDR